jgi:hypothetical protein
MDIFFRIKNELTEGYLELSFFIVSCVVRHGLKNWDLLNDTLMNLVNSI